MPGLQHLVAMHSVLPRTLSDIVSDRFAFLTHARDTFRRFAEYFSAVTIGRRSSRPTLPRPRAPIWIIFCVPFHAAITLTEDAQRRAVFASPGKQSTLPGCLTVRRWSVQRTALRAQPSSNQLITPEANHCRHVPPCRVYSASGDLDHLHKMASRQRRHLLQMCETIFFRSGNAGSVEPRTITASVYIRKPSFLFTRTSPFAKIR